MKKLCFQNNSDGFYGTYYPNPKGAKHAMIGLFGDDPNDFMAKCGAKWLHKNGVNVLCMSPDVKNYSHVNYPLERIETAIQWLKSHGNQKIGIMGMSTAGMDSLAAASYFLSGHHADIRAYGKRFYLAGIRTGRERRLQGVAGSPCVHAVVAGQAAGVYAVRLRAPHVLSKNPRGNKKFGRYYPQHLPVYRLRKSKRAYGRRNDKGREH